MYSDTHSFPTRRSSDLYGLWMRRFGGDPSIIGKTLQLSGDPHVVIGIIAPQFDVSEFGDVPERSEEHTSELQSPCNLVCRLLLEKTREMPYQLLYGRER